MKTWFMVIEQGMIITEEKETGMTELIRKEEMIVVECGRRSMIVIMSNTKMTTGDREKGRTDRDPSMKMH
jgi:hypothetical protein